MSANELYRDQRLGTAQSFRRLFLVLSPTRGGRTVDPRFDDELRTKARPGTSVAGLPFAIAGQPNLIESFDGTKFLVEVPYDAPSRLQPGFGGEWRLSISASPDTERRDTVRRTQEEIADKVEPVIVGAYPYRRADSATTSPAPSGEPWEEYKAGDVDLILDPADKAKRIPVGMDVLTPNDAITFIRRFPDNRPGRIMELYGRHLTVNSDEVGFTKLGTRVFFPRQLILWSYDVTEENVGEPNTPIVHDVSVTFAAKPSGWQKEFFHTYTDPNATSVGAAIVKTRGSETKLPGAEDPSPDGTPVGERFRRQFEIPFNGWLESLQ